MQKVKWGKIINNLYLSWTVAQWPSPLLRSFRPGWWWASSGRCWPVSWEPWWGVAAVGPKSWAVRSPPLWRALHSPQRGSGEGERWGGGGWSSIWPLILEPEREKFLWLGEKQLRSDWGPGTIRASPPAPTPLLLPSPCRRPGRLMVLSKTITFSLLELSINILHEYVYTTNASYVYVYVVTYHTYTYTTLILYN